MNLQSTQARGSPLPLVTLLEPVPLGRGEAWRMPLSPWLSARQPLLLCVGSCPEACGKSGRVLRSL